MSDKGVCRTAPATQGLLNIQVWVKYRASKKELISGKTVVFRVALQQFFFNILQHKGGWGV